MTAVEEQPAAETLSERVARRLRGAMAENQIVQTRLARALGLPQQNLSRRLKGITPFTLNELQEVSLLLDVPVAWLLGEDETKGAPRRVVLDEGRLEAVRHVGLEPTTRCFSLSLVHSAPAPERPSWARRPLVEVPGPAVGPWVIPQLPARPVTVSPYAEVPGAGDVVELAAWRRPAGRRVERGA